MSHQLNLTFLIVKLIWNSLNNHSTHLQSELDGESVVADPIAEDYSLQYGCSLLSLRHPDMLPGS